MRIARVRISGFRGYREVAVVPRAHVLLVGEPRSGRTDLLSAIALVLDSENPRAITEFDFHQQDTTGSIDIEVTLVDLDPRIQQRFLDQLEFWEHDASEIVRGSDDPSDVPDTAEPAIRLAYRARWDVAEEAAEQVRYWPKTSDPGSNSFNRVSRVDRSAIPFVRLRGGRPLNIAPQGGFRAFINSERSDDLADAMDGTRSGLEDLSRQLADEPVVVEGLTTVLEPLRPYLGLDDDIGGSVRFAPEGGSLAAFLRNMLPSLELDDAGFLPLSRHGSTTSAQVEAAELVARGAVGGGVVLVDDFGDCLDAVTAEHLAGLLRSSAAQVWLSTRRAEIARAFEIEDLVRLARRSSETGERSVHYGSRPTSKSERLAARELHRQLLPAMTAKAVVVVEGPHDLGGYSAVAERLESSVHVAPTAYGIRIIDAGGGTGGIDAVPRVCALARSLGFRAVAIVDYDSDEARAAERLAALLAGADSVVRLPPGTAVESAILDIEDAEVVDALHVLNQSYSLPLATGWDQLAGQDLRIEARKALKSNNGLHAAFVGCLERMPGLARRVLSSAVDSARGICSDQHVQL